MTDFFLSLRSKPLEVITRAGIVSHPWQAARRATRPLFIHVATLQTRLRSSHARGLFRTRGKPLGAQVGLAASRTLFGQKPIAIWQLLIAQ